MDKGKQLFFDFFSLTKTERGLNLQGVVKKMPRDIRIAAVRKMLQIYPRKLITMEKIVDNAKRILEMYNLQAKDLLASKEEKQKITSLVEDTIGGIEFFTLKGRHRNWEKINLLQDDIKSLLVAEEEKNMLEDNKVIKTRMITELTRLVEEGKTTVKEITAERIRKIYTQLYRPPTPLIPIMD